MCKTLSPFRRLRRFWHDESGTQFVEFAFILPMLVLIFAVIVDGGRMMWSYQATGAGVRDATRYLARVVPADVCGPSGSGSVANFTTKVGEIVQQSSSNAALLPDKETIKSVTPGLACVTGTYRPGTVGVASVTADLEITFPLSGTFRIFGMDQPTIQTRVSDQSRIYGS